MDVIVIQILLGVNLFFIINWIGKHSFSVGYVEISLFVLNEDSPAINFLIRVLTPIVYILITSAILYAIHLDRFVYNFYLVNIYAIVFRLLFNLITQRGALLNWPKQILYWIAIISISYLVYIKLIRFKQNLLPDLASMANELWIIIVVFLFQLLNGLNFSKEGAVKRKNQYLKAKYKYFKSKYGRIITSNIQNEALETIAYAILIYEDFNRPKIVRWFENLHFYFFKKKHSLGVMQFPTDRFINDKQSVDLGTKKIRKAYDNILKKSQAEKEGYYGEFGISAEIISNYNAGSKYFNEVSTLTDSIKEEFYNNSKDLLNTFNLKE